MLGIGWKEVYLNGSPQEEAKLFGSYKQEIRQVQRETRTNTRASNILRAQHAKGLVATKRAKFRIKDVPEHLRVGLFQPGRTYDAVVRFSNAHGAVRADDKNDLRGVAIRVAPDLEEEHDFLMTNAPKHHARNVPEIIALSKAFAAPGLLTRVLNTLGVGSSSVAPGRIRELSDLIAGVRRLFLKLGLGPTWRIMTTLIHQTSVPVESLATETYYSRAPIAFGPVALKYRLVPEVEKSSQPVQESDLHGELGRRLARGDVGFHFQVQLFVNESETPIEDPTKEWPATVAPFATIATLTIEQQDLTSEQAVQDAAELEAFAFDPWNVSSPDFRPLGEFNRARRVIYPASVRLRRGA